MLDKVCSVDQFDKFTGLFSDLMKFSVENESLSLKQLVCSVIDKKSLGLISTQQNEKSTHRWVIHDCVVLGINLVAQSNVTGVMHSCKY